MENFASTHPFLAALPLTHKYFDSALVHRHPLNTAFSATRQMLLNYLSERSAFLSLQAFLGSWQHN